MRLGGSFGARHNPDALGRCRSEGEARATQLDDQRSAQRDTADHADEAAGKEPLAGKLGGGRPIDGDHHGGRADRGMGQGEPGRRRQVRLRASREVKGRASHEASRRGPGVEQKGETAPIRGSLVLRSGP
jgi:hypothetical protein